MVRKALAMLPATLITRTYTTEFVIIEVVCEPLGHNEQSGSLWLLTASEFIREGSTV